MTEEPDVYLGATEDGYKPPYDPDDWEMVYVVKTTVACPECRTVVMLNVGPSDVLEEIRHNHKEEYGTPVREGYIDEFNHPSYVYCENPTCKWAGLVEWKEMRDELSNITKTE